MSSLVVLNCPYQKTGGSEEATKERKINKSLDKTTKGATVTSFT
jgi:hypothetical protein